MEKAAWDIKKKQQIPYTEVDNNTFSIFYDSILKAIEDASYIAIDTEFSGHTKNITKNMEDRYKDLSEIIRTHSLLSFGLTVISTSNNKEQQQQDKHPTVYNISNFEFLTLEQQSFKIDPTNIKFLIENGFDFGRVFQFGIPFTSGGTTFDQNNNHHKHNNSTHNNNNSNNELLKLFWYSILRIINEKKIPIVVHNGLLDIMYLYDSFITSLPPRLSTFIADLVEIFPSGIYDTKFISTSIVGESKSYLAYLYCKYSRLHYQQQSSSLTWFIQMIPSLISNELSPSSIVLATHTFNKDDEKECSPSKKRRLREKKNRDEKKISSSGICGQYSQHGWCKRGGQCPLSHDLDDILDFDLGIKKGDDLELNNSTNSTNNDKNDNSNISNNNDDNKNDDDDDDTDDNEKNQKSIQYNDVYKDENKIEPRRDHASHFDAYMTAFIFCYYISTLSKEDLTDSINKLNLMRLKVPLRIAQSHFSNPSEGWISIKSKIWPTK